MKCFPLYAVFGAVLFSLAACSPRDPSHPRYVLARGDGFKVERREVDVEIGDKVAKAKLRKKDHELPGLEAQGLEARLEKELLRLEAKRLGVLGEARKAAGEDLKKFRQRYASNADRKAFFDRTGTTEEFLEERTLDRFILLQVRQKTGISKPSPLLPSVSRPSQPPARPPMPKGMTERLMIRQLWVPVAENASKEEREAAQAKAAALAEAWKKTPASWPRLAGEAAGPGYQRGQFFQKSPPEPLKAAVAKLKPGEISPVTAQAKGFHVFQAVTLADLQQGREGERREAMLKQHGAMQAKWDAFITELKERYHVKVVGIKLETGSPKLEGENLRDLKEELQKAPGAKPEGEELKAGN